jgi:hypothetical protein
MSYGDMNVDGLQQRILAAARALPRNDHVPYAFEKRIMARLTARPVVDAWALWSRLLWRAAAPCVAIMLVLSAWTVVSGQLGGSSETLAADFERTVWGPLTSINESW